MPSMGGKTRVERFIIIGKLLQQQRGECCRTIGSSSMKSKALLVVVAVRMIAAVVLSCGVIRSLSFLAVPGGDDEALVLIEKKWWDETRLVSCMNGMRRGEEANGNKIHRKN
jgi:hypothetical protein